VAETRDAAPLAERLVQRLTEHEPDVLDEVVRVALDIAGRGDTEVEERMASKLLEHVVEHADTGRHLVAARAVEVEGKRDTRLARAALDVGPTFTSQRRLPFP